MAESARLTGWGRAQGSTSVVERVSDPAAIVIDGRPRGHLARGLGRAYGDAALNSGGMVWDTTGLDSMDLHPNRPLLRVGAGVSYHRLLTACLKAGFFPPVAPGTRHVTIGGAIAADIHGKNHHRDGSLRHHLSSLTIKTGDGQTRRVGPGHELFEASIGGMGLTGVILEATMGLLTVPSERMLVETVRTDSLPQTLEALTEADTRHRYTVAWIDMTPDDGRLGRGLVDGGDHASPSGQPSSPPARRAWVSIPRGLPSGLINRLSVSTFNRLWYRRAPRRSVQLRSIDSFFFPLDAVGDWNRLYGKRGFLQYQFAVPDGSESALASIITILARSGTPALAVLKRFGDGAGLLSFPLRGWTLAVDMPVGSSRLAAILDEVDWKVANAGGRVYLAKDSRMRRELVPVMYPELAKWRDIVDVYDPDRHLRSDLDRRLGLRSRR